MEWMWHAFWAWLGWNVLAPAAALMVLGAGWVVLELMLRRDKQEGDDDGNNT